MRGCACFLLIAGSAPGCGPHAAELGDTGSGAFTWAWGDLHAHSNWSHDGCEDPDAACRHRGSLPAADFLAEAERAELDFVALTDHAEADLYWPEGVGGASFEVWPGQLDALRGEGPLALAGYEWTNSRSEGDSASLSGSHRTVLFEAEAPCADYRVPGRSLPASGGGLSEADYEQASDAEVARTVGALWARLDGAAEGCAPTRWLSFAHHSAYELPQVTDWTLAENAPVREQLVEVYSEHGSSECADLEDPGCDFAVNDAQGYYPSGSVQAALEAGWQLGFVGGTDSHDARPGSLDDGPGPVAQWDDVDGDGVPDTVRRQFVAGGLTGALISGPLDRTSLLDALEARRTVATSGPRPDLVVEAVGRFSESYAPGATIPGDAFPVDLRLAIPAPEGAGAADVSFVIDRIEQGRGVVESVEASSLRTTWDPAGGEWTYLRVRYRWADGTEDRVWVSPFFAGEVRSCGCAGLSAPGGTWSAVFGTLALLRRRRARGGVAGLGRTPDDTFVVDRLKARLNRLLCR